MTPIEIKALRLLKKEGRMKAAWFAQKMGWAGRSAQGAARNGAGYLARLAKKGLVEIHHDDGRRDIPFQHRDHGYYAQISTTGELALIQIGQQGEGA